MLHDSSDSSYHNNDWHADIRFETYSDARLAAVFLDNMDRFPVDLYKQVIDVIIDPQFKSTEVTFKSTLDAFERVSTYRGNMAPGCTVERLSSGVVPPVVLGLVVDTIVQQNIPLGIAAENSWRYALAYFGVSLRNMSLVHRSWTNIAQRGLRRRAIIPSRQIHRFLVNPLCGPWVTEMIIYWTLRPKDEVIRDFYLLEGLLERTPNVCSLAFITSDDGSQSKKAESLQIQRCFDTISGLLPCLRRLWLKHITDTCESMWLRVCDNLNSVCKAIPKLRSLEFLSIDRWVSSELEDLNWNENPPSSLKSISLCLHDVMSRQFFAWLLSPRNDFSLQSLFIGDGGGCPKPEISYRELLLSLQSSPHQFNQLSTVTWAIQHDDRCSSSDSILLTCHMLTSLELIYDRCYSPRCSSSFLPALPPSLTHLTFRCPDRFLQKGAHVFALRIAQSLKKKIPTLPQLQSLLFIIHPYNPRYSSLACQGRDSRRYYTELGCRFAPAEELLVADLTDFCNNRNIHLACVQAPSLARLE